MFGLLTKKQANKLIQQSTELAIKSLFPNTTYQIGGIPVYNYTDNYENAYTTIDDLYSIVRKIAKTAKRVPLYSYVVKDEEKFNKYKLKSRDFRNATNKNINELHELQKKSLELLGENDPLQKILDVPNQVQSKDEFYEACYTFMLLNGNRFIWQEVLKEGANNGKPYAIYNLPPALMTVIPTGTFPRNVLRYEFWFNSQKMTFEKEEIIHSRYPNPSWENQLVGLSPLQALSSSLQQSKSERDYSVMSLQNAGAYGAIFFDEAGEGDITAIGNMKTDFYKEVGAVRDGQGRNVNAKKIAFLAGKGHYQQFGISPADMQLANQMGITFKKLCNGYGVSDILFNNSDASTESNVQEMVKQMYLNVVLPEVNSLKDALQKGIAVRFKDKKRVIDYDITDIPELQEDVNDIATRFSSAPAFRINDLYEAMGWGRLDDPNAEVVLVKQGYSPLEEIAMPLQPVDTTELDESGLNDYSKDFKVEGNKLVVNGTH